jgi:hypothetical protein
MKTVEKTLKTAIERKFKAVLVFLALVDRYVFAPECL